MEEILERIRNGEVCSIDIETAFFKSFYTKSEDEYEIEENNGDIAIEDNGNMIILSKNPVEVILRDDKNSVELIYREMKVFIGFIL